MVAQKKPTYTEVKSLYENLRDKFRDVAHEEFPSVMLNRNKDAILKSDISLDGITLKCLKELRKWEETGLRQVSWDWDKVIKKYRTHPKRFELSIWYRKQVLCGATIGAPTWSEGKLRLDFIEANPISSPLNGLIVDIVIATGVVYADAIGATQLRIMKPVNDDVKELYLSKPGFSYNQEGHFCYRDL